MRALALGTDSPNARQTDPITSHIAASSVAGRVAASQAIVYRILTDHPHGLTDEEIRIEAAWSGHWSPERLRTARAELVDQGRVHAAGTTTLPGHRNRMTVWEIIQ